MLNELQLENHYKGIGGTMASSIMGFNQFQSNVDAYLILTDENFRKQKSDDIGAKLAVQIGKMVEPIIIAQAANEKGWDIEIIENTLVDKEHSFLIGHPDFRIKGTRYGGEVKARGFRMTRGYGEEGTDEVLDPDYMQCQHYMMLDDLDGYFVVLWDMAFNSIKYFFVDRNEDVIKLMREREIDFWINNVLTRRPPKPITYQDAVKIYPSSDIGASITASAEIEEAVKEANYLRETISTGEKSLDFLKAKIANFIGNNSVLENSFGCELISFKNQDTKRLDTDLLKKSEPAIYEKYLKVTTSRVMRFKK